jgi:2-phosphosulfolactate phosphatase
MTPFDQAGAACRLEWGLHAMDALGPADVVIVVDVLSFSTCVDVAVGRGVTILPYTWKDGSVAAFAEAERAELAGPRGQARYSLSARSFITAPAGLRCVLPSPNGAMLTLRASKTAAVVFAGCLRNARAVAEAASAAGATFNVCPAGERWPDGSLRPAFEDMVGAGAILRELPGAKSAEAAAAIAAFEQAQATLRERLLTTGSGRELVDRGDGEDVVLAAAWNASTNAPRFDGHSFGSDRALAPRF